MDYQKALELTETARGGSRKLQNNTRLETRPGGNIAVRLHDTDVITYHIDDSITLDSGGWKTITTKARINEYMPGGITLRQKSSVWYIETAAGTYGYADGMVIRADGSVIGAARIDTAGIKKIKRAVKKYVDGYLAALRAGNISLPGAGDCFYCGLVTENGETWGEKTDGDHIRQHMKEKYYVPSLLTRAIEVFGTSIACKQTVYGYMVDDTRHVWPGDFIVQQAATALRRFMYRQLGMAA